MASYGTIYQFSFDSVNGADIDIFILKKNYTGARQQRALGRAPVLKRERSGSIFGTSLEIYAECLVDGEFAQLYTSSADEYKVEVYKHQELIWTGFVSPELYSEPDIAPPYDVQIIATDGLGELKNYTFEAMGEKSLKDHLLSLMAHTGLDLPYMRVTTLDYTDGDGAEFFWYLLVDLDYLEGKNCYDVLKILLDSTHAQMTQQDAAWLIARECDYAHLASVNGVDGYEGDNAVVLPVASFGSMQSHKWWPVGQLITTIHPAYKGMTIESERTYKASILQNSDMTYMGGWEAIAEGVTFLTDEGGYALKQAEAAIRQDVNIGILDRGLTLNVSAMLGDGGDGQDDKKLLIYIYALDGTSWVMMYPDGSYWGVGAGPVEMELNDNLSNIDVNIPVNASFSAIRVVLKSAGGWHKIVKSCHLRQSYMPKGEKVALTLANGARGEADDVSVELSNKGIRDYIYRYAVIRDSRLDTAVKVTTYDFPEGSFLDSLMARDYAKSIALPRMKITGVLNVPADGYMPVLFIRDDAFYIPQTYNYDLYNDEVSVELLSIPTAVISVESEKVTELDNASSGGSVGGGGSSGGPSGGGGAADVTIDTEMSDTSVNPVQNKVIKAYVDDAVAKAGAGAVIFDATCSSDPWSLNVLQTETTLEEMTEAINNGSPIYMRFGSGLVAVANAELYENGGVSLYAHLVDSESEIIRTIHTYSTDDGWAWESTDNPVGGGGDVDTAMSAISTNAVQNKVIKTYVDNAETRAYDNAIVDAGRYTDSQVASKAGAFYVEPSTNLFIVFTTEAKKAAYIANGDASGVLGKFALGGGGGASETLYTMRVTGLQSSYSYTTASEKMMISAQFESKVKYAGSDSYETFSEDAVFSVDIFKGGEWKNVISQMVSHGGTFSADLKPYVANGDNTVRVTASGVISSASGVAATTVSVTTMSLSAFGFDWAKAWVQGQDYRINLRVQGSLAKTLYVQINGNTITESVGTWNSADVAYGFDLKAANHPASSGVYQLKMWLKADASGVTSETLTYNIMCVKSSEVSTAKLVCINEVATEVDNYSESKIFAYAAYNGGGSSATPTLSIVKGSTTIASSSVSVNTGVQHDFTYAFALAMTEMSAAITAKAVFGNTQIASITLKNETSFAPVSGYTFYMNAATRSNGDTYKTYLVNEANGERIYASWKDMAWVDGMDGWTTDEDGNKCLLIPALSKAYVNYAPMQNASVLTLEMQYKVKNVSDFNEDIITIASGAASSWMGVKVKPTNITLHSQSLFTDDLKQGYNVQDEKMVHLVVAIIQNYQSTGNIAIIYVNGVKKCSFEWSRGDTFSHSGELVLGSDTADLYLYMMRVYATQFDWPQVMQNYISSIHSAATKAQTKRKEDSVLADNDTFDYDKIYGKYNTFVVELPKGAALPNILNQAKVKGTNLYINIMQDKTCSIQGEFLNVPLEGQGTTAMTYYRWNLRSKTDDNENYNIRITAKKNVASSMHSHKMGATRLFNDLNRAIVGANEANGRVAVYQYPVYGFLKVENEDAVGTYYYEPIGLYTIGPDKGDKPTFGYDNSAYKSTLIHMEGTDHSPRGVGMDYPWEQMTVGEDVNGDIFIGPKNSLGQLGDEAWEIGACGDKKTASDMKSYLDVEFAPAYKLDYECTPLIAALPSGETIASVNANVAAFREIEAWEGFTFGDCIIFNGSYDTYYFNEVSQSYVADGRKAYEGLTSSHGFSTSTLANQSDKAAYIRQCRKARYRAEMSRYWHLNDSLFHACFLDLIGATDNEKKNSYPYKFGTLASGSRWRWRQDDLDTIFDVNNQGSADKSYSILNTDKQGSTMIFKGNTSYHWRCIREYYKDELKTMMQTIFSKMISLSPYGSSDIQKLVGCIHHYFWDYAQEYFTGGAYNLDAKWTYEDAWRIYKNNSNVNRVHPLEQSLGSHYEAEVAWVTLRMLFLASMNEYGAFTTYNDISEGQIAFRQGGNFTFNLTPAIDMRPSVIQGQSKTGAKFASGRVKAGSTVAISTLVDSSADTLVSVQAADWLSDAGDFCTVRLGSTSRTFAITSKRLQKIKVGDVTASKVTTNIEGLDIGACPSVEEIDARNIAALHGEVDLTKCPRLRRAYFGGTSATSILLPDGSKIQTYNLPSTIQRLTLRKLPLLTASGITASGLNALSYLWVEDNKNLEGYALLKSALEGGSPLNNIRVVGFDVNGTTADIEFLKTLANGEYHAVDEQGNPDNASLPYLEGSVYIAGTASGKDITFLNEKFPVLAVSADKLMEYAIDRMFLPETTSDTSHIINTGYRLFSDEMPQWTLRINLSDIDYSKMPNLGTAVTCANEAGAPYAGIHLARYSSERRIKLDINPGNTNIILTDNPPTIIIRRNGDILESSTNGGASYTTRMASVASVVSASPRLATVPMIVGGYYDANGNVGRPFYGRVQLELYLEVMDF